MDFGSTI